MHSRCRQESQFASALACSADVARGTLAVMTPDGGARPETVLVAGATRTRSAVGRPAVVAGLTLLACASSSSIATAACDDAMKHHVTVQAAVAPRELYDIGGFRETDRPYVEARLGYSYGLIGALSVGPVAHIGSLTAGAGLLAVISGAIGPAHLGVRFGAGAVMPLDDAVPRTLGRRIEIGAHLLGSATANLRLGADVGAVSDSFPQTPQLGYENYFRGFVTSGVAQYAF